MLVPGLHRAGPTALHVALLPQSASPSSGSASGSASRGRGFNSCSSCNARGCGRAIVTRSHSPLRRARERAEPALDALSSPAPLARRLLSSPRNRAEPCGQLQAGNFREAFGRGRGLRVTTGVKAEAPWRLKGLSPYSRECACACVRGLCSAVRERAKYVPDPRVQHKLRSKWPLSLYLKYTARLVQDTLTNKVYSSREPWWRIWEGGGGKA